MPDILRRAGIRESPKFLTMPAIGRKAVYEQKQHWRKGRDR